MKNIQPIYLFVLLLTLYLGCRKWKWMEFPDKIVTVLIGVTVLQETVAYICYEVYGNNMFTYHIYSPIEFLLLCYFFNLNNSFLKKYNIGIVIGITGIALSIFNTFYLQPYNTFNSYFLLFEGTIIISMCLLSLCEILLLKDINFKRQSYFWITLNLLFYWSITYTGWGIFNVAGVNDLFMSVSAIVVYFANMAFYICFSLIFLNYKKLNSTGQ